MPKHARKPFEAWMKWALARALETAPRPDAPLPEWDTFETREAYFDAGRPYFGRPLPLEAFDPELDYRPERDAELLDAFLRGLDHTKNPFLRSPEAMKAAGFSGTPYRFG